MFSLDHAIFNWNVNSDSQSINPDRNNVKQVFNRKGGGMTDIVSFAQQKYAV